jgi:hypothetical protein
MKAVVVDSRITDLFTILYLMLEMFKENCKKIFVRIYIGCSGGLVGLAFYLPL